MYQIVSICCNRLNSFPALQGACGTRGCLWCGRSGWPVVDDTGGIMEGSTFTTSAAVWCAIGTGSTMPRGAGCSVLGHARADYYPTGLITLIYLTQHHWMVRVNHLPCKSFRVRINNMIYLHWFTLWWLHILSIEHGPFSPNKLVIFHSNVRLPEGHDSRPEVRS